MHRYIQFYYENRLKIWTVTLAIVFIIVLIQVLNGFAKEENNEEEQGTTRKCCSLY